MVALRIDSLNDVYRAAGPTVHSTPEWLPHPERFFQVLVAAAYGIGIDPAPPRALDRI